MSSAVHRGVVRRADAHHDRADVDVSEIELQHLERPLHGERRKGVDDRAKAGESKPARNSDHQLLADANVYHAVGMRALGIPEPSDADVREDHGDPLVALDKVSGGRVEALAHRGAHPFDSTTATIARGRPRCSALNARSSRS